MLTLLPRRVDDSASTEPGRPPEIEGAVRKAASRRPIQDNARTEYAGEKKPSEQSNGGRRRGVHKNPLRKNAGPTSANTLIFQWENQPLTAGENSAKPRLHGAPRGECHDIDSGRH